MSLSLVLASIPSTVRRHEPVFARVRDDEPELAPFPAATALLEALSMKSALAMAHRQSLVVILIERYRVDRHPLWQALLFQAFEPVLFRLRMCDRGSADDRDQRVVCALLEALGSVRPGRALFVAVQRASARVLFGGVRAARAHGVETTPFDDDLDSPSSPHVEPGPFRACLVSEVLDCVRNCVRRRADGEEIVRLLAEVETPAEQAARRTAREGRVTVASLQQRRRRTLRAVRSKLAGDSVRGAR
ncbi:MAG TPA: hypothetical protein VHS09_08980 [Polyangiaceae bacterium]|jgi:hypothetical protein|nr:hypothetical protein [Polyangiaceae bacterium]